MMTAKSMLPKRPVLIIFLLSAAFAAAQISEEIFVSAAEHAVHNSVNDKVNGGVAKSKPTNNLKRLSLKTIFSASSIPCAVAGRGVERTEVTLRNHQNQIFIILAVLRPSV